MTLGRPRIPDKKKNITLTFKPSTIDRLKDSAKKQGVTASVLAERRILWAMSAIGD